MAPFVPFERDGAFLPPPDLKAWLPEDNPAHFVVAARAGGKPRYYPRMMLALLIYSYANGVFSSRQIERASYRDIAVRFGAAGIAQLSAQAKAADAAGAAWGLTPAVICSGSNVSRGGLVCCGSVYFHDGAGWRDGCDHPDGAHGG